MCWCEVHFEHCTLPMQFPQKQRSPLKEIRTRIDHLSRRQYTLNGLRFDVCSDCKQTSASKKTIAGSILCINCRCRLQRAGDVYVQIGDDSRRSGAWARMGAHRTITASPALHAVHACTPGKHSTRTGGILLMTDHWTQRKQQPTECNA